MLSHESRSYWRAARYAAPKATAAITTIYFMEFSTFVDAFDASDGCGPMLEIIVGEINDILISRLN